MYQSADGAKINVENTGH